MLTYHDHILCVEAGWLYKEAKVITLASYKNLTNRGGLNVIRKGGGANRPALVEFETMRPDIKEQVLAITGDPYKKAKADSFERHFKPDYKAAEYFGTFKLPDGRNLPDEKQREYRLNAEILNALHEIIKTRTARRKALGGSVGKVWDKLAELINKLDTSRYPHKLPSSVYRLKKSYKDYIKEGYLSLVSKKFCNDNSRKVTADLERLIMSLYVRPNKPYSTEVHDDYLAFLGRALEVVDFNTGEVFNPDDFRNEKGEVITVSEATVYHYLNMPHNRIIVDKYRSGSLEFSSTHRPHHHRHAPQYSLSKISMDDRDLPRKMPDGNRVKAYYAYDVTSGCIIGAAYSKKKDTTLFIDCMRNMFRFLDREGLGTPLQVEVEHHLVQNFKDGLMKAENVFRWVRWGNPGNAQEKHAEHFHRQKKYGYEKKYQNGIGRFYAKLEANRTHQEKIFDEENNRYKEDTYSFEQLVADDRQVIESYHNDLHPNQKKYPGKSRLDVLYSEKNPEVRPLEAYKLALYIGDKTETTVRRSQYFTVRGAKYQLPSIDVLERLNPNLKVDTYYIPEPNGSIDSVFLFQDDLFICECEKINTYNTANSEWTGDDSLIYTHHAKYVSEFDAKVKKRKAELARVSVSRALPELEDTIPEIVPEVEIDTDDFTDLVTNYSSEEIRSRAKDSL